MKFEVRWTKQFSINFFGQLIRPGGTIQTSANLAIQLHDEKEGWVCDAIDKARKSLLPPVDVTITDKDLNESVQVPAAEIVSAVAPVVSNVILDLVPGATVPSEGSAEASQRVVVPDVLTPLQPALGLASASPTSAAKQFPCDKCTESFPSKKKLTGHKASVHSNG